MLKEHIHAQANLTVSAKFPKSEKEDIWFLAN